MLAAAWAIDVGAKAGSWTDIRNLDTTTIVAITATVVVIVVIIAGQAMARWRGGLILTIVAFMGIFVLSFKDRGGASGAKHSKLLLAASILAIILTVQFALYRVLGRFGSDPLENARVVFAHVTIRAAMAFMPFGAGLGTFVPVYQMFEGPSETLANVYANHAHNDILEIWLETGILARCSLACS